MIDTNYLLGSQQTVDIQKYKVGQIKLLVWSIHISTIFFYTVYNWLVKGDVFRNSIRSPWALTWRECILSYHYANASGAATNTR